MARAKSMTRYSNSSRYGNRTSKKKTLSKSVKRKPAKIVRNKTKKSK